MAKNHLPGGKLLDVLQQPGYKIEDWPNIDIGALHGEQRQQFLNRRKALDMYVSGHPANEIMTDTGIRTDNLVVLIRDRCLATHEDGRIYGFRGLLPYLRVKRYLRTSRVPSEINCGGDAAGAFSQLFRRFPELHQKLDDRILKRKRNGHSLFQSREAFINLHAWFIDECRKLGLEETHEYPFNTKKLAYVSLVGYVHRRVQCNPITGAKATYGEKTAKKLMTADGTERPVTRIFQRVEVDAHKIDAIFCVLVPSVFGELIPKIVHRLWIIAIKEVVSRAILGYHLSLNYECNRFDLLKAVHHALAPNEKKDLTIPGLMYRSEAGFPSNISSHFTGACWEEMSVDEAMINQCKTVVESLQDIVGSTVEVIPRHLPDDRPFIERFFLTLAQTGYQRLPNTTGNGLKDERRNKPNEVASKWEIQLEHLEELTEVLIANYNATPHHSVGYRSPLQYLSYLVQVENYPFKIANQTDVTSLLSMRKTVTVKGGIKQGRRPYIQYLEARYSNDILGRSYHLAGKKINIVINEVELRTVSAFHLDGSPLGILRAAPPWDRTPHSLIIRQAVNAMKSKKLFELSRTKDPVLALIDYVESARNNKKLKVMPAYLEARRILVRNLPELQEWESIDHPQNIEFAKADMEKLKSIGQADKKSDLAAGVSNQKFSLPSRRKTVQ